MMPTGFTDAVGSGEVTDFSEYALTCARAFGACVMIRDTPISSEIPVFEVSDYHANRWMEAREKLKEFESMDDSSRRELYEKENAADVEAAKRRIEEKNQRRERYEKMLEKARAFTPPSPEHDNYAKFIVEQLEKSIEWDCDTEIDEQSMTQIPFEEWQQRKLKTLNRNVSYHAKENENEIENTATRNKWVRQLKEALGIQTAV